MITKTLFGVISADGQDRDVFAYTLQNEAGMRVKILNYGGTVVEVSVPDRNGIFSDVVGGYDDLSSYLQASGYQGALVGRFGNRIAKGRFFLDGREYVLAQNKNGNHLHGGICGFNAKIWDVTERDGEEPELVLHLLSPDGDEGYPGNLDVTVTYSLTEKNGLRIHYEATTDRNTPVNLTNHTYFNLRGYAGGSVHSLHLTLDADAYLPTDETMIPTGEIRSVEGTPFDFREGKTVGRDIGLPDADLIRGCGYDHCMRFTDRGTNEPILRGTLYDQESGRVMELYTDQPCVQFYSGNHLNNPRFPMKGGCPQSPQMLLCLETEAMPDSMNHEGFTDCILRVGQRYDSITEYRFSVR